MVSAITELKVGEALVLFLDGKRRPRQGGAGLDTAAPQPSSPHYRLLSRGQVIRASVLFRAL